MNQDAGGTNPTPPPPLTPAGKPELPMEEAKMWAMFCHLAALIFHILGPIIVWLIKKDESSFVDAHGKEAVNFQLTMLIWMMVAFGLTLATCGLLFPLPMIVGIADLVMCIIAGLAANRGEMYRYPMTIRFIK